MKEELRGQELEGMRPSRLSRYASDAVVRRLGDSDCVVLRERRTASPDPEQVFRYVRLAGGESVIVVDRDVVFRQGEDGFVVLENWMLGRSAESE